MKKIIGYLFILIINYFLITGVVFLFSYISLLKNKTYDLIWIKSIQTKLYYGGLRNIWQYQKNCTKYDLNLLYVPKEGVCEFNNPEFTTKIAFNNHKRLHSKNNEVISPNESLIAVIGDSVAMGWGVNDNETFSYHLERLIKKKVINLAVSSYGTIREIKRLKSSKYYDQIDTIIIQYNINDIYENKNLDFNKTYSREDYENIFLSNKYKFNKTLFLLRIYKKSLRLLFSDIKNLLVKSKRIEKYNLDNDILILKSIIKQQLSEEKKRILVILIQEPHILIENIEKIKDDKFEFLNIKLEKNSFFIVDEHPNNKGHQKIAAALFKYLSK